MSLGQACIAFLVQTAFGSLLSFLLNDREALGPKYFKFGGWVLVALYGLAASLVVPAAMSENAPAYANASMLTVLAAGVSMLAFASVSGWDKPGLERVCLGAAVLSAGAAVVFAALGTVPAGADTQHLALILAVAFVSSLVLGFTTWAMILGHWYLTDHSLDIKHLGRLVKPLPWIFGAQLVISSLAMWLLWQTFLGPDVHDIDTLMLRHPERVVDVVNLWARLPVGALVPLVLSFMTLETVRLKKTQPATGILYAMCVTVYMGDLMGKMVHSARGVPW
ncbi:MAG: hypothetical protein DHS20C15_32500 [Planctomycetota bacterium]|nr:MAG: hypothetical protein DHS20C15_32500 [Planctomycetota bacterium]